MLTRSQEVPRAGNRWGPGLICHIYKRTVMPARADRCWRQCRRCTRTCSMPRAQAGAGGRGLGVESGSYVCQCTGALMLRLSIYFKSRADIRERSFYMLVTS